MALTTYGHFFERHGSGSPAPCLLAAVRYVRGQPGGISAHSLPRRWILDYSISDCGRCRVGKETAPWLRRGPAIAHLYPPGMRYWEDTRGRSGPVISAYLIFTGGRQAGLAKFAPGDRAFGRFRDPAGRLGELLQEMAAISAARGDASFWLLESMLFRALDLIHGAAKAPAEAGGEWILPSGEEDADTRFVRHVQAILSEHLNEAMPLVELAARLRVSPSTLSHRYRRLAGESPQQTMIRLRVGAAKSLLLKGEGIKEVAARTGFHDEFHFSKAFKQAVGIPPSQYRKGLMGRATG